MYAIPTVPDRALIFDLVGPDFMTAITAVVAKAVEAAVPIAIHRASKGSFPPTCGFISLLMGR